MKKDLPETTLFMLSSVDGKISTGNNDDLDVDKDFSRIHGIKEGLKQYYDLELRTDFWSFNTGRVMAKVGINEKQDEPKKIDVLRFVLIDNKPHLNKRGILYLSKKLKDLYIITTNKKHPAEDLGLENVHVIKYKDKIDLIDLFRKLRFKYGADKITVQSGGTVNSVLLREGLIDKVSIVVAPALVGGKDTATLIDGMSLSSEKDLRHVKALKLVKCDLLKNSYLHLQYNVIKETKIEKKRL